MTAPIHIMRWAPADYLMDGFVQGCYLRRDYKTLAFYSAFLFRSFAEGGSLPANPDTLVGFIAMPKRDLVPALEACITAGKLVVEGDSVFHRRVRDDFARAVEIRDSLSAKGRLGVKARLKLRSSPGQADAQAKPLAIANSHSQGVDRQGDSRKPPTHQQELFQSVTDLYREMELEPPKGGQIGRWSKLAGSPALLLELLNGLANAGHLSKGEGYVAGCLKRLQADGSEQKIGEQSPHDPALDGNRYPNLLRHSSYFGRGVPEAEWRPLAELEEELGPLVGADA